jgi:hypothetical protein
MSPIGVDKPDEGSLFGAAGELVRSKVWERKGARLLVAIDAAVVQASPGDARGDSKGRSGSCGMHRGGSG